MGETKIEWTDRTWNPTRGCSRVSEGCRNCYAERVAARFSSPGERIDRGDGKFDIGAPGPFHTFADASRAGSMWTGKVELIEDKLLEPLSWRKPGMCFVNSMSDLFHESLPDEAIDRVFAVMALAPHITFQVLTKRARRMREYMEAPNIVGGTRGRMFRVRDEVHKLPDGSEFSPTWEPEWPLPNVWLGVSVENQAAADEQIPELVVSPAVVRFLSVEPMLGAVDLTDALFHGLEPTGDFRTYKGRRQIKFTGSRSIHWVIVGGESGPGARPCNIEWIRDIVRQCKEAGVACFVKQLGANPQEIAWPAMVSDTEASRWMANRWTRITDADGQHWRKYYRFRDKKGGDPSEWPEQFPREFPEVRK